MEQGNPVEQGLVPVWPFIRPSQLGTALIPQNWGTKRLPLLPLVLFVLPLGSYITIITIMPATYYL